MEGGIKGNKGLYEGEIHERYNGGWTEQWIKVPKATWTSPILRKRSTCRTFFYRAFFMKDDVKVKMSNGTPKILILLDGVLKSSDKPEGDHATHFWG